MTGNNNISSTMKFNNYIVKKASFEINENFEPPEDDEDEQDSQSVKLDVDFNLSAEIIINDDDNYIELKADVGDNSRVSCPFQINVVILGIFGYEGTESEKESFLKISGISVLFPYLRSLISEMSIKSNLFPDYRLPLINVSKLLEDQKGITIINNTIKKSDEEPTQD